MSLPAVSQEQPPESRSSERELLELLLEASTDGVMDWDLISGEVRYTDRWKLLLGYETNGLQDSPTLWIDLSHPDDVAKVQETLRDHLEFFWPFTHTWRMKHANGEWRWVMCRAVTARDKEARATRLVAVFSDITDRVQAEERQRNLQAQLMQAHKLESIGQLAAGIAHEINTPMQFIGDNLSFLDEACVAFLSVIAAQSEVLKGAAGRPVSAEEIAGLASFQEEQDLDYLIERTPRAIETAREGVKRVANIVSAMKEFSHPGRTEKCASDLNKELETTITISSNAWKYVADVERRFDPELPLVNCHTGEINQVVLNLIVNAAHAIADRVGDASGGKGLITISTGVQDGFAEIRVSDTGTGIPEHVRHRIFDPFFTTKEVGKGTGQGLAIARNNVVERHGGTLEFETEMGKGTTFVVRLPLAPASGESTG